MDTLTRFSCSGLNWRNDEGDRSASEAMLLDLAAKTHGKTELMCSEAGFQSAAIKSVNPVGAWSH
jgi:hypothetical protein